ncbi:MAG: putative baseplate assembly protein, partial [Chloroflexota bacterium]
DARKRLPVHSEEWTDHNVSDPGVTMIELFAWMTDMILYRLNRVPDRHYVKFMEMLGISLKEAVPARAFVTFWLSSPQDMPVSIPAGTEVASTQTETERSIIFTTNEDFIVAPPRLTAVLSHRYEDDDEEREYVSFEARRVERGLENVAAFSDRPQEGDALYFGFSNDVSHHILGFELACDPSGGAGIDPSLPPYIWESSTGSLDDPWQPCQLDDGEDTTQGLNVSGRVRLHLPEIGKARIDDHNLYWVRLRLRYENEFTNGMRPYRNTPRLDQVNVSSWGGSTYASHAEVIKQEALGESDGSPGQTFSLQATPVLQREEHEHLLVYENGQPVPWTEVPDFSQSGPEDRHYTLDSNSGELRFGPAVRQPDGDMRRYGRIPARGARLVFRSYRSGGGLEGNVQAGVLNTLKTAIPYISEVNNREPAVNGLDAETVEAAAMRVPALLRSRERAVTEADFEFLTRQALRDTGWDRHRVKCLQPRPSRESRVIPGQIYVLIIPHIADAERLLRPTQEDLELKRDETYDRLVAYLNRRRLLTSRLDIREPVYHWVAVRAAVRADASTNHARVEDAVLERLYRFLNPLVGGPDGKGWPFGRNLVISDVYQALQGVPGVEFLSKIEIFVTTAGDGPRGEAVETVDVVGHGTIASGIHEVTFA